MLLGKLFKKDIVETKKNSDSNPLSNNSNPSKDNVSAPLTSDTTSVQFTVEDQIQDTENVMDDKVIVEIFEKLKSLNDTSSKKVDDLKVKIVAVEDKMKQDKSYEDLKKEIDQIKTSLKQFSSVYEMISDQYNPFKEDSSSKQTPPTTTASISQIQPVSIPTPILNPAISSVSTNPLASVNASLTVPPIANVSTQSTITSPAPFAIPSTPSPPSITIQFPSSNNSAIPIPVTQSTVSQLAVKDQPLIFEKATDSNKFNGINDTKLTKNEDAVPIYKSSFNVPRSMDEKSTLSENFSSGLKSNFNELKSPVKNSFENMSYSISDSADLSNQASTLENPKTNPVLSQKLVEYALKEKSFALKNISKSISDNQRFFIAGVDPLANLFDLIVALHNNDGLFEKHVTYDRDDFSDWIYSTLDLKELSLRLKKIKDKDEYILAIISEAL
jgi:hypothetical protein